MDQVAFEKSERLKIKNYGEMLLAILIGLSGFYYTGLFVAFAASPLFLFFVDCFEGSLSRKSFIVVSSSLLVTAPYLSGDKILAIQYYLAFSAIGLLSAFLYVSSRVLLWLARKIYP